MSNDLTIEEHQVQITVLKKYFHKEFIEKYAPNPEDSTECRCTAIHLTSVSRATNKAFGLAGGSYTLFFAAGRRRTNCSRSIIFSVLGVYSP